MANLVDILTADDKIDAVVDDLAAFVDSTVNGISGFTGMAIKTAYNNRTASNPELPAKAARTVLPNVAKALDPYWQQFVESGQGSFGDVLAANSDDISQMLVAGAAARVEASDNAALKQMFGMIKGKAAGFIADALPDLGAVIEKHAK